MCACGDYASASVHGLQTCSCILVYSLLWHFQVPNSKTALCPIYTILCVFVLTYTRPFKLFAPTFIATAHAPFNNNANFKASTKATASRRFVYMYCACSVLNLTYFVAYLRRLTRIPLMLPFNPPIRRMRVPLLTDCSFSTALCQQFELTFLPYDASVIFLCNLCVRCNSPEYFVPFLCVRCKHLHSGSPS